MTIQRLHQRQVSAAVERCANYYRKCRLYLNIYNTDDAYDEYIEDYTHDTELIVEQGYSYLYKNDYLIAVDPVKFRDEHPEEFQNYFGYIWNFLSKFVERESCPVLFMCAVGPQGNNLGVNSYKLINQFVKKYGKHTILTDCPIDADMRDFSRHTGSTLLLIGGEKYFRWSGEK